MYENNNLSLRMGWINKVHHSCLICAILHSIVRKHCVWVSKLIFHSHWMCMSSKIVHAKNLLTSWMCRSNQSPSTMFDQVRLSSTSFTHPPPITMSAFECFTQFTLRTKILYHICVVGRARKMTRSSARLKPWAFIWHLVHRLLIFFLIHAVVISFSLSHHPSVVNKCTVFQAFRPH